MLNPLTSARLESAVSTVCDHVKRIPHTSDWMKLEERSLWYELVACTLGSRVKYELSLAAVRHLDTHGLLDIKSLRYDPHQFEARIRKALSKPIFMSLTRSGGRRYPYPKLKANQIRRTAETIYLGGNSIRKMLRFSKKPFTVRLRIMSESIGIGPKQASLFLRNIGFSDSMAILDSHVLRYMFFTNLIQTAIQGVTTLTKYERKEALLRIYARQFHVGLATLDTAIWVVMRVAKQELGI